MIPATLASVGRPAASLLAGLVLCLAVVADAGAQTTPAVVDQAPDLRSAVLGAEPNVREAIPGRRQMSFGVIPEDHSPGGALWRAAVLPGWGQIYNRQYVKLPFVYAAMGGLVAAIISLDNDYDLYNRAFQYKAFQELVDAGQLEANPRASFQPSYDRIASVVGPVSSRPLEIRRNNLRRGRDLSAIGLGLVYGLAMLDAYVSAHLLDFDVGEDLGVAVTPGIEGFRISARVQLQRSRE
ncbi:MAG: hypothetical protein HKN17_08310 [Rhodothermales bacterium]|nr:hypothetical protein [Rhodothermales bacterium]